MGCPDRETNVGWVEQKDGALLFATNHPAEMTLQRGCPPDGHKKLQRREVGCGTAVPIPSAALSTGAFALEISRRITGSYSANVNQGLLHPLSVSISLFASCLETGSVS